MQLSPKRFYSLTWGQYNCRVRGWLRQQEERWEHTRTLYALHYNLGVEKKHQKPADKLIPLAKDRRRKALQPAPPVIDREALIARILQRDKLTL